MAQAIVGDPQGSSAYVEKMEEDSVGRLPMEDEWSLLCAYIVSGQLRGTMPPGFLWQFRSLPNEILLRIWDYIPAAERRSYRSVCRHWKALWESLNVPKTTIANIRIFMRDGKLVIKICRSYFSHRATVLEISPKKECLEQALSLIELQGAIYGSSSRAIVIGDGAARKDFLEVVARQRWDVHSLTFFGDLTNCCAADISAFVLQLCNAAADIQLLCFSDANVNDDLITDEFAKCIPHSVKELIIGVSPNCIERLGKISLTDASLPFLLKHERVVVLPPCRFTSNGIEASLKDYFRLCYERVASSIGGCIFFPAQFHFLFSGNVDASQLARIHMDGVETALSRPNDDSEQVGKVEFSASADELQASVDLAITSLETYKELINKYRPEDYRSRTPRVSEAWQADEDFNADDYDDEGRYVSHFRN